jgi:hypothetical protein
VGIDRSHPPSAPLRVDLVPRRGGGHRHVVRLTPRDDARYRGLVGRLVPAVERGLGPAVLGNRTRAGGVELAPFGPARARWRAVVAQATSGRSAVAVADVAECYRSIAPRVASAAIASLGGDRDLALDLERWLSALRDHGVEGLPVGPEASAHVASAVLVRGDRALVEAGAAAVRWVDEWVIAADGRAAAVRALDALRRSLEPAGLRLHDAKTLLWADGREAADVVGDPSAPARRSSRRVG